MKASEHGTLIVDGRDTGISTTHLNSVTGNGRSVASNKRRREKSVTQPATVGMMKLDRMVKKNARRAANGLPPLDSYAKV